MKLYDLHDIISQLWYIILYQKFHNSTCNIIIAQTHVTLVFYLLKCSNLTAFIPLQCETIIVSVGNLPQS